MICWLSVTANGTINITLPATYSTFWHGVCCYQNVSQEGNIGVFHLSIWNKTMNGCRIRMASYTLDKVIFTIGS